MRLRKVHPTDLEMQAELHSKVMVFGPVFQHQERCKPCRRRWLTALGLERLIR